MTRFIWFTWVLLCLLEGCLAASTITRIKAGPSSSLLEAQGSNKNTIKSREERGSKIFRIFRPPTQKELKVREKFKSSFIFNKATETDSTLPRKRTRKILKRMNSVTESDILRPALKFVVNGGQVNTEYRDTFQYQQQPRARSKKESRKADDSGTQNVWSIEDDFPEESSALLSTLLIDDDNSVDDFTDATIKKDIDDQNVTADVNPTMNTLSAEFEDELFEEMTLQKSTNLDTATVNNNLKGETLENFDVFDGINDAEVSNQITGNDDALEISEIVDYSSEEKKYLTLNNNIPRSQDHEVDISSSQIDQSLIHANNNNAYSMIDKQQAKNQENAKTKNRANDKIKNAQSTMTTTIKTAINNDMETTDYNDNVYINSANSMIIDIKSSSQAPITHSDEGNDTNYAINEIINNDYLSNNSNESKNSSEKISNSTSSFDKNMTLPDTSPTLPSLDTSPTPPSLSMESVGKNSLQTSNESENTNYNTYGTAIHYYEEGKSEDVTTTNNSNQIIPPALDAKPPLAAIKNNAYADYETSSNGVEKADQDGSLNQVHEIGYESESRGRNTDILYNTIESIVANQNKNKIVDSLYNWLSQSVVASTNFNAKRTEVQHNFANANTSDFNDGSHFNLDTKRQYIEKYPYIPMVPFMGYPLPYFPVQQNAPGYRQNVHIPGVLIPVLHVPYMYLIPVHPYVHGIPPHQHLDESQG